MKLELEELESFKVGDVIPEREARRLSKENGRRVLSSRWVNTVKRKGLYRSRLVVRDYASLGGSNLSEGIFSYDFLGGVKTASLYALPTWQCFVMRCFGSFHACYSSKGRICAVAE